MASIYDAFRATRLQTLRGAAALDMMHKMEREEALRKDLLNVSVPERNTTITAINVNFDGPQRDIIRDIDLSLTRPDGEDDSDMPPMPDVLQILANLTGSRQKWRPGGCMSLSIHVSDLGLAEDPLADEDDKRELRETLLPRLFAYGLRHFELSSSSVAVAAGTHNAAVNLIVEGLELGRATLRTVALRGVGLSDDALALDALLQFIKCNTVLRHLDLRHNNLIESQQARIHAALDTPLSCVTTLLFDDTEAHGRGTHRIPFPAHHPVVAVALPDYLDGRLGDLTASASSGRPDAVERWKGLATAVSAGGLVPLKDVPSGTPVRVLLPPSPGAGKTALMEWVQKQLSGDVATLAYPCHLHETQPVHLDSDKIKDLRRLVKAGVLVLFGGDNNEVTVKPTTLQWTWAWHQRAVMDPILFKRAFETRVAAYRSGRSGAVAVESTFELQLLSFNERKTVGAEVTDGVCRLLFDGDVGKEWQSVIAAAMARECNKRALALEVFQKKTKTAH